jgi:hypothetical protein
MALLTAEEVKDLVTMNVSFDEAFFALNIDYAEKNIIKPILTTELYDAYVDEPTDFLELTPLINNALAYAVAFISYEKDLEREVANQGIMENSTQYSKSADNGSASRLLAKVKQFEFDYCKALGDFLIANAEDYPLFDAEKICYEPNLRRFFPI